MEDKSKEQLYVAEILSQFKRDFGEILRIVAEREGQYPVVFKAIVDKSGKITIPFAEREVERLGPNTIVQVKLKVVGRPSKDSGKRSGVGIG